MNKLINDNNLKQTSKLILDKNKEKLDNYKNDINNTLNQQNLTLGKLELRTHIGKELSVGTFKITGNLIQGQYVNVEKVDGNIQVSEAKNGFILEPFRTYILTCEVGLQGSNCIFHTFKNKTDNIEVGINCNIETTNGYESSNPVAIITPSKQIEVGLFIKTLSSSSLRSGNIRVQEIQRQVILDPVEYAKNLEFDYGLFGVTSDVAVPQNGNIVFNKTFDIKGNIILNEDGSITLDANKKYKITAGVSSNNGISNYCLYNITDNKVIEGSKAVNHATAICVQPILKSTFSTTKKINIIIRPLNSSILLNSATMFLEIEEVIHPYYFNYFKDSISSKTLFEGSASSIGNYELTDDVLNYEWFIIEGDLKDGWETTTVVTKNKLSGSLSHVVCVNSVWYSFDVKFLLNKNQMKIIQNAVGGNWASYVGVIKKITGYCFNYQNPYRDIQKEIDVDNLSDETIQKLKTKLGL